jgi:hypothetical protein
MNVTTQIQQIKRVKSGECITRESSVSSISSESYSSDYENYVIKANVCTIISRELNLPETAYEKSEYIPPPTHGMENSDVIIPAYYNLHKNTENALHVDYYTMIKDDIRNYRPLNKYQLEYIKNLDHDQKNELFDIYNECINTISSFI